MQFVTSSYIKIHKDLLSFIGLWPYQTSKFRLPKRIFYTYMFSLTVIVQLAVFTTHTFNMATALDVLSLCLLNTLFIMKYATFWVNNDKFKTILDMIDYVWMNTTKEEHAILEKYAEKGFQFTIYFIGYLAVPVAYIIAGYLPEVLDLVLPLNETRPRQLPVKIELFIIDQENHFHFLLLGVNCVTIMAAMTMYSTETVFFVIIQQSCAFYKLASCCVGDFSNWYKSTEVEQARDDFLQHVQFRHSYRIDYAMRNDAEGKCRTTAEAQRILISGIQMHNFAIQFTHTLELCFNNMYFFYVTVGIISSSLNIFCVVVTREFEKLVYYAVLVIGLFFYNFYIHFNVQDLIDHASEFFNDIYSALWYNSSPSAKKLILFVLQGNFRTQIFMLGGIYAPTFEGYTAMVNLSMSYFMVLYSTM